MLAAVSKMNFRCSVNLSGGSCLLSDDVQGNSRKSYYIKTKLDSNTFLIKGIGNLIAITQFLTLPEYGESIFYSTLKTYLRVFFFLLFVSNALLSVGFSTIFLQRSTHCIQDAEDLPWSHMMTLLP